MNTIKAIIFDLGNVIINFDIDIIEKEFASYGYVPDGKFKEYVMYSDIGVKYMQGEISSSIFYNKTRRRLKIKIKYNEFYDVWNSIFSPNPDMEKLVMDIKKKYPELPLVLLSDTNEEHFSFLQDKYDVLGCMDHYVLSHEVGKVKPHPSMYKEAIRRSGVIPKDIFYTDDRPELIKAARVMGLRAFQFTGHEELRAQLVKFDIMV